MGLKSIIGQAIRREPGTKVKVTVDALIQIGASSLLPDGVIENHSPSCYRFVDKRTLSDILEGADSPAPIPGPEVEVCETETEEEGDEGEDNF